MKTLSYAVLCLFAVPSVFAALPRIAAAEQKEARWVILDPERPEGYEWQWSPRRDPNVRSEHWSRFGNPSEVKPTADGKLLVACSCRAFAKLDVATCRAEFYGVVEAVNPHSIDVLPDGRVAIASSDGNSVTVVDVKGHEFDPARQTTVCVAPLRFAHGVVWDAKRSCLWALGLERLVKFAWDGKALTELAGWNFKEAGCGFSGHDLALADDGTLVFTTHERVNGFDPETGAFSSVSDRANVKSVSRIGDDVLTSVPRESWWTDTLLVGDREIRREGARFYKARFYTAELPPFALPVFKAPEFPARDFPITDFGAKPDGSKCTAAFAAAMSAAHAAGGGRVVVPAGKWTTGKIHFRSGCDLHLEEGAVIESTDDPADYLPSVPTSWEGVECYNYSPLFYAYACTNVAITGKGLIAPKMDLWREWFKRPPAHMYATECLYHWCSTNAPLAARDVTKIAGANVRPHLIQFNRCANVLLDGFSIKESPFWMIHLYLSSDCIVRDLRTDCHGHNNDGVDVEMTRNVLVEDCVFNQGDDGIVLKSGRNQDAWRLATPTENVVVRNCRFEFAHVLIGVGSEMSGGVRNVWMHDCEIGDCYNMFYLKTNRRRGGFIENIYGDRLKAGKVKTAGIGIETDVLYQWADFPDYEIRYTPIRNIVLRDSSCEEVGWAVRLRGDEHLPPQGVTVDGFRVGKIRNAERVVENCKDVEIRNLVVGGR